LAAEPRRTPDQDLPKRIGRYEAFLQIGAGGMARVYLAAQRTDNGQSQIVVVKVLRREAVEDENVLALFMDEARIAMRLTHPNVIRTREVVAEPPDYLLAMDFHDGQSLLQVLRRLGRQAVPLDEHIYILSKVLAGLSYAHELRDESGQPFGIVHRDVSPANVLVCYTGEVKLLDFGIAKATGALAATQDGVVKGKLGYAAPEQCLGKPADPRSDVYAVGVMLWEAIAGRRRASGETWHSVLQARLDDAEPSLEEVCPDAPEPLLVIARKALGHEPDTRYATAKDFQKDLEAYLVARAAKIGPSRIATMLKPHFDQDRAEQRQAIEAQLTSLRSNASGQRRRVPLPGPLPAAQADVPAGEVEEEDTSRIPVDDALLMKSKRGSMMPPGDSDPSNPRIPALRTMSTPPAQNSNMTTAPPPRASVPSVPVASLAPPLPPSRAGVPVANVPPPPSSYTDNAPPVSASVPRSTVASSPSMRSSAPSISGTPEPPEDSTALARFTTSEALPVVHYPGKKPGKAVILGGAGAALCLVVIGAFALHKSGSETPTVSPGASVGHDALSPSATTGALPSANEVKVRFAADPPNAELRLDGRLLKGNPFVSVFPKEGAIHELSASADGYRDEKQVVQFSADVDVTISLRHPKAGSARAVPGRPALGAAAAAAAMRPSSEARPAGAGVEPGMDLQARPDNRSKHNIDEKDPYSQ
jgi:serine/threonine-protein kinase